MQPDPMSPFMRAALELARHWAGEAGLPLALMDNPGAMVSVLIEADAGKRAHWRCALDLVRLCQRDSGLDLAGLLAAMNAEPVNPLSAADPAQSVLSPDECEALRALLAREEQRKRSWIDPEKEKAAYRAAIADGFRPVSSVPRASSPSSQASAREAFPCRARRLAERLKRALPQAALSSALSLLVLAAGKLGGLW